MQGLKWIFLTLGMSIAISPISLYAADNTADLKRDLALLKNQLQDLEKRIAVADQPQVAQTIDNSGNNNANVDTSQKKTIANKDPAQNKVKKAKVASNKQAPVKVASSSDAITTNSTNTTPQNGNDTSSPCVPISWQGPDISALIAGGASAGFMKPFGENSSFNILDFNPLLLFTYRDLVLLRSSVDFSLDNQGNTAVGLDVLNFNLFINDYVAFVIGKSDTSLGSFIPNISPAWINRLPDAPVGFNDNQAAPQSELGARLQGGFRFTENMAMNYIVFVANGPQAQVDTTNNVIDSIATDGFPNNNGTFIFGGRIGFLPIPKLEIGLSAAAGKLSLMNMSDDSTLQNGRDYRAFGGDAAYKPGNWDFRMEYIQQQVSSQFGSIVPQAEKWKAWYAQVAYWIPTTNFEPVVRYGRFLAPTSVSIQDQRQWAFGLDYWFTPSFAAQAEYELNQAPAGSGNNTNFFMFQLVFGY